MSDYVPTRLEDLSEFRKQFAERTPTVQERVAPSSPASTAIERPQARLFRPLHRPPMALVGVVADNREDVDWRHVRGDSFVIGRVEGDLTIPHDKGVSGRHLELARVLEDGEFRWYLQDLKSTNGTFARVDKALLKPGQELLLGSRRYRFDGSSQAAAAAAPAASPQSTQQWQAFDPKAPAQPAASLVELAPAGEGRRFPLERHEQWIGGDPQQSTLAVPDDPFLDPRHARIYRDNRERWLVESTGCLNGTWARIDRVRVVRNGEFQIGEQRLFVRIP